MLQFRFDPDLQNLIMKIVGNYNVFSADFFVIPDAEWPNNEIPSDTRPLYKNCSFEKYQISDNENG